MPRVKGRLIAEYYGLKIFGSLEKAKKFGKDRVWIQIRQDVPKEWRIAASLSYVNGADVRFEK